MAADVQIRRWTGVLASEVKTDISSINTRANAVDTHTVADTASPVQIPGAGTKYSYWVSTRLFANTAPDGTIDNIRWHTDGTANFGTGVDAIVAPATAYVQATGTPADTGNELTTGVHSGITGAPVDAFSNYPAAGTALAIAGSIVATTGDFANFAVYQITVTTTADPGPTVAETFTWLYDET